MERQSIAVVAGGRTVEHALSVESGKALCESLAGTIWDPTLGFPALGALGQFLIKDIALLGISLAFLGESAVRLGTALK